MISTGIDHYFLILFFPPHKKAHDGQMEQWTNQQANRWTNMVAVGVMMECQGPGIGISVVIFAFSAVKKTRDRPTDGRTNPLKEMRGCI